MAEELFLQFRRSIIYDRVAEESFIPQVEADLMGREDYLLAYRMWKEGDRTTAARLIVGELAKMGYGTVIRGGSA